jgi:hypothetical protein
MFTFGLLRIFSAEYKVVDFQDQVGPEVRMIPFGSVIAFLTKSPFLPSIHKDSSFGIFFDLSTILITIFSPFTVGRVEILRSRGFSSIVLLILPS